MNQHVATDEASRICASIIVKNEEAVILRCLESLRPIVDFFVIVDTGSTDKTKDVVRGFFTTAPGELFDRPWVDFAYNRTEALELARPHGDYTLIIDADDFLEFTSVFQKPHLTADAYFITIEDVATSYVRLQLVNNRLPWRYRGILHEFLESGSENSTSTLAGVIMRRNHDGARRKDPKTYLKDAEILEKALAFEEDDFLRSRYRFYLAQSYRDCGNHEKALEHYLARAELGFWNEEIYVSLLQAARMMEQLDRSFDEIIAVYDRSTITCPTRAEALHGASRLCRKNSKFAKGADFARRGLAIAKPQNGLFLEQWVYDIGLDDELSINCYWAGSYQDAIDACDRLLTRLDLNEETRLRVHENKKHSLDRIKEIVDENKNLSTSYVSDLIAKGEDLFVKGDYEKARIVYLRCTHSNATPNEIYASLLRLGEIAEIQGHSFQEILAIYERASAIAPERAEALHRAARICFANGKNREGYEIAKRGLSLVVPKSDLMVEPWVYEYGLLDEYATNAYWAGFYRDCLDACLKALQSTSLPEGQRSRIIANASAALTNLPVERVRASTGPDFISQHELKPIPESYVRLSYPHPRVLVAILVKQKEKELPFYLHCIEGLDYPKKSIFLYIRTNNNTDNSAEILGEWIERVSHLYAGIEFDQTDVTDPVQQFGVHEWNPMRFRVLGHIRNISLKKTIDYNCDYYFVADVDNFIRTETLSQLVACNLPIVAPLLRAIKPTAYYSNLHADIDPRGYYKECAQYYWILERAISGIIKVPLVHCTYLVRADVIPHLSYIDGSDRFEYVVFADTARKAAVAQYVDNRQIFGFITFDESNPIFGTDIGDQIQQAKQLLGCIGSDEEYSTHRAKTFESIYKSGIWGRDSSSKFFSGVGSRGVPVDTYLGVIGPIIEEMRRKVGRPLTIVDLGCGDFEVGRRLLQLAPDTRYIGCDVVPSLVAHLQDNYGSETVEFRVLDIVVSDLPIGDVCLIRQVLQHLPNADVHRVLKKLHYTGVYITEGQPIELSGPINPDKPIGSGVRFDFETGKGRGLELDKPPFSYNIEEIARVLLGKEYIVTYRLLNYTKCDEVDNFCTIGSEIKQLPHKEEVRSEIGLVENNIVKDLLSTRVAVGVTTFNRKNLVQACALSLHGADHIEISDIIVIDDCSTEFDVEYLKSIFPDHSHVIRRDENSGGADYALYGLLKKLLESTADVFVVLDSDMIVARDFITNAADYVPRSDGLISLYNSSAHAGVPCDNLFMLKNSIGAAGSAWSRELLSEIIANVPFETYYDWCFSRYVFRTGKRIMSVRYSCIQHIGFLEGQHASLINIDFGIGFTGYYEQNLSSVIELILFAVRNEISILKNEIKSIKSNSEY